MTDLSPDRDPDAPDVPDKTAPAPPESTTVETGDVEGDVTVAPPPHSETPPADPGQPDGDVKPASDGPVDEQSTPANQELQKEDAAASDDADAGDDSGD